MTKLPKKISRGFSLKVLGAALVMVTVLGGTFYYLRPFSHRMGAYVTDLKDRSPAQRENILRVGETLEEVIVPAGGVFSLNQHAGPYTEDRGYQAERSFLGKKVVFTPGGGVCQVAGTLYNAALQSGLKILERIPHSAPVSSVPPGKDATLAYGVADLKFLNPYSGPVKIRSRVLRDQLVIEIWGRDG